MLSSIPGKIMFWRLKTEKTTFAGILFGDRSILDSPCSTFILKLFLQPGKRITHKVLVHDFSQVDFLFPEYCSPTTSYPFFLVPLTLLDNPDTEMMEPSSKKRYTTPE